MYFKNKKGVEINIMKKRFMFILLMVFSLALVACGGGDRGNDTGDKFVEWYELADDADYNGEAVTITFWHRMGGANQAMLQTFIGEFNEIYPNITVNEVKEADRSEEHTSELQSRPHLV